MKQLKSFIPFRIDASLFGWLGFASKLSNVEAFAEKARLLVSRDPAATQWSTIGLAQIMGGGYCHDLDGAARMLVYQFNDRNLPAPVILEAMKKKMADFEERQGRAPNKTEYMQFKESVVEELLPRSHIRRTLVPVFVFKDLMLVYTTSVKKAEDVMIKMHQLANLKSIVKFEPRWIETNTGVHFMLKQIALQAAGMTTNEMIELEADNSIKLKGVDKRVISVKDRAIVSDEVQAMLKDEAYLVTELGMELYRSNGDNDPLMSFSYTDKGIFKNVKVSVINRSKEEDCDEHATCWMAARLHKELHDAMLDILGGEQVPVSDDDL